MRDTLTFSGIVLVLLCSVVGISFALAHMLTAVECEAYGEVTGRKVVYDWGCYAADDDGRMVPAGQIDKRLTVTTK